MSNYPTRNGVDSAEALDFTEKRITISTTVQHRGRQLVITSEGYTADELCDLLDKRFGKEHTAPERPGQVSDTAQLPDAGPPLCPVHRKPMKQMKYPSKQGHVWHCTAKDGDNWCAERA